MTPAALTLPEVGTSLGGLCAHLCPLHPWMVGQSSRRRGYLKECILVAICRAFSCASLPTSPVDGEPEHVTLEIARGGTLAIFCGGGVGDRGRGYIVLVVWWLWLWLWWLWLRGAGCIASAVSWFRRSTLRRP